MNHDDAKAAAGEICTDLYHSTAEQLNLDQERAWLDQMTSHAVSVFKNEPILYSTHDVTARHVDNRSDAGSGVFLTAQFILCVRFDFESNVAASTLYRLRDIEELSFVNVPNVLGAKRPEPYPHYVSVRIKLPSLPPMQLPLSPNATAANRQELADTLSALVAGYGS